MNLAAVLCFLGAILTPLLVRADALDQWMTRTSPVPVVLNDVVYGDNRFVAVGTDTNNGLPRVIVSSNGVDWIRYPSSARFSPRSVTHGSNGLFVAVGRTDLYDLAATPGVIVSTNGTNWSFFPTFGDAFIKTNFESVTYGNGMFVAVGLNGIVAASTNGTNWDTYTTPTPALLTDVAYGQGMWVAVGPAVPPGADPHSSRGPLLTSIDGINWVQQDPAFNAARVLSERGLFIALGGDNFTTNLMPIRLSADATNWVSVNDATDTLYRGFTYGGGAFVSVARGAIKVSLDGSNWVRRLPAPAFTNRLFRVAYGASTFVAVGEIILQSGDIRPTLRLGLQPNPLSSLYYDGQIYLRGISNAQYVLDLSHDLAFWQQRGPPRVATGGEDAFYFFGAVGSNTCYRVRQVP